MKCPRKVPIFIHLILCLLVLKNVSSDEGSTYCASYDSKVPTNTENGELLIEKIEALATDDFGKPKNATAQCQENKEFCYTFWYISPIDKNRITILMQGCWHHPDSKDCLYSECIARSAPMSKSIRNNTRFCCCLGSMCNVNVTDSVNLTAIDLLASEMPYNRVVEYMDPHYAMRTIIISLSSVGAIALLTIFLFLMVRCYNSSNNEMEGNVFLVEPSVGDSSIQMDIDDLKFDTLISKGRYGEVYKSILGESEVAVKIYYPQYKQYYNNEREIYSQPHMLHPYVAQFCGFHERISIEDGMIQYMIITSYVSLGTLGNYLKNNTIDWYTLCRMCHSIAAGLSHLHSELVDGDKIKSTIVHRDINSRNILVKADLSCCICDFGFAMKITTSRLTDPSTLDDGGHASLADVGTLRYMAPEVLEGAVNLYDCKTSLTQVDVYALGLVFWEIGIRCHEIYQGLPTPEYKLPFEAEVGPHPLFEDMQVLVSRNKTRPLFPDMWKDTNLAIRSFKDTIEECWDQDAEARISAVCIEERTRELSHLWDARHKCITPMVNFNQLKDIEDKTTVEHIITSSQLTGSMGQDSGEEVTTDTRSDSNCDYSEPTGNAVSEQSVSTATIDTTMLMSPQDVTLDSTTSNSISKVDCNVIYARMNPTLQPHQGQNPTVERNTHKRSDEELVYVGNSIVNRGDPQPRSDLKPVGDVLLIDALDSGALIQNDILDFHNRNMQQNHTTPAPIARRPDAPTDARSNNTARHRPLVDYVPNQIDANADQVAASDSVIVRPKQQNIPTNGGVNYSILKLNPSSAVGSDKKPSRFSQLKKQLSGGKFALPSFNWLGKGDQSYTPEARPVHSEVCLVNGGPIVRPTSLPLGSIVHSNGTAGGSSNLQSNLHHERKVNAAKQRSHSSIDLSPPESVVQVNGVSSSESDVSSKGPNGAIQLNMHSNTNDLINANGHVSGNRLCDNFGYEVSCSPCEVAGSSVV